MSKFITEAEIAYEEGLVAKGYTEESSSFESSLIATLRETMRLLEEVGNELHRPSASTSVEACWNEVERFIAAYKGENNEH